MSNKNLGLFGVALAVVLFLVVNLFAGPALRSLRADLTEQKLYTLSEGTRNIASGLEEPVTLRYFFPESMMRDLDAARGLLDYGERVREMLDQYVVASMGKVRLEVIDPEPFSEEEELAATYGIQGLQATMQGDRLYFGLVGTNSVDQEEVIPTLDPGRENKLEYDITALLDKLDSSAKPVVGLLTGLPLRGGMQTVPDQFGRPQQQEAQPWAILELLSQNFDVRDLDPATLTEVPDDVDILLMIHPKGMTPAATYAVDQWSLAGGKVAAFVDPHAFYDPKVRAGGPGALEAGQDSGIDPLLWAWGVEMLPSAAVGDEETKFQVQGAGGRASYLPLFFSIKPETMDQDDIIMASLTGLAMMSPGSLSAAKELPEGLSVSSLFTTTEKGGGTLDPVLFATNLDPTTIDDIFAPSGGPYSLGVRVRGTIRSVFPDGPPAKDDAAADDAAEGDAEASDEGEENAEGHLAESTAPFNAIVIGDTDMLFDTVWGQNVQSFFGRSIRAANGNAPLLLGILESLSGSNDLIGLRSREPYARPFSRKAELAKIADERFRAKETELDQKLSETEARLSELQSQKSPTDALLLSPEQEAEIERFQEQRNETRRELRRVRRNLEADIEALGARLKLLNVLAVPAIIAALVASWVLLRRGRTSRPRA